MLIIDENNCVGDENGLLMYKEMYVFIDFGGSNGTLKSSVHSSPSDIE